MNMMSLMKQRRYFFLFAALMIFASVSGQCRYCNTYEDFLNDRWIRLGAVSFEQHSKSRQAWWGGNGYTKAIRIGNRSILFVNKLIGEEAQTNYAGDT